MALAGHRLARSFSTARLSTHYLLGLWAFYERRHFGWTATEVVQLVLGLSIPFLLMNHLYVTRISLAVFGTEKGYAQELYSFWVAAPHLGILQVSVLIVAWIHGCIGVYHWLRLKPMFSRWMPYLFCGARAGAGAGAAWLFPGRPHDAGPGTGPGLARRQPQSLAGRHAAAEPFAGAVARPKLVWQRIVACSGDGGAAAAGLARTSGQGVPGDLPEWPDRSRAGRVLHAGCKPKRRHSTCQHLRWPRALLDLPHPRRHRGGTGFAAPSAAELAVLRRIGAEPGVRLACQSRPSGDVRVAPLLPSDWPITALRRREWPMPGEERFIVVLMVDMRDSTRLAETRLPFDAVFIVDRFVTAAGLAVTKWGAVASVISSATD